MKQNKIIAVIDLKAFYAYVECIDRGLDPWKTPLVVADVERSVNTIILSVSPYLKSKGIPSRLRLKDLPKKYNYIYATPRMSRYIERSSEVISILLDFVSEEDIHVYSIDEAFIDLTSYLNYYQKTPLQIVELIILTIKEKTGLQATGGIGDNFFLSKVALDLYAKQEKNGIATMHIEDVKTKLWPISPLTKIWGIGQRLCDRLNKLGIFTVQDLATSNKDFLVKKFGIIGEQLYNHANGIDEADIHEEYVPKERSLTVGQTLIRDYTKDEAITVIREMNDDLSSKLRSENKIAGLVAIYVGYSKNVGGFGRQMSLLKHTDNSEILFDALMEIYNKNICDLPIRRLSIVYSKLKQNYDIEQLDLFNDANKLEEQRNLQLMLDEIHNKYGKNICLRASALTSSSTAIERHNQIGGHRK